MFGATPETIATPLYTMGTGRGYLPPLSALEYTAVAYDADCEPIAGAP